MALRTGLVPTTTTLLAAVVTTIAGIAALSGCEVTQINWSNHFYAVSRACAVEPLTVGGTTVHNAVGITGSTRITVEKVYHGDLNHDGILDAAVLLSCTDAFGGNASGNEIQIFTRDAKPVARLVQPDRYGTGNPYGSQFAANEFRIINNVLYSGAYGYLPGDAHCCPSAHDVYRWDWNGSGFTPVDVQTNQ